MNYPRFTKLQNKWLKRNPLVAGELRRVNVQHDDWCRMMRGKGDCNCQPIFRHALLTDAPGEFVTIAVVPAPPAEQN